MNTILMQVYEYDTTGDIIDQAQIIEQINRREALKNHEDKFTQQQAHAIERKNLGLSKICEDCGMIIPKERRERYPEVTRCVRCQYAFEQRSQVTHRSHRVIRKTTKIPNIHTPTAILPTARQRVLSQPAQNEPIQVSIFTRLEVDVQTG